jgi:hypothetical protein
MSGNNTIQDTISSFDILLKENVLNKPIVYTGIYVFLILYASLAAPRLPKSLVVLFNSIPFRVMMMFFIGYLASKDVTTALLVTIGLSISMHTLNSYQTDNIITNVLSTLDGSTYYGNNDLKSASHLCNRNNKKCKKFISETFVPVKNQEQLNEFYNAEAPNVEHFDQTNPYKTVEYYDNIVPNAYNGYEYFTEFFDPTQEGYEPQNEGYNNENEGYESTSESYNNENEGYNNENEGYNNENEGYESTSESYNNENEGYESTSESYNNENEGYNNENEGYNNENEGYKPMQQYDY